jgi:peptidoglycan hydrolase CwlO-like protein
MKLIIGLFIFICITAITVYFSVKKEINNTLTIIFLTFAIASGLAAANYDVVRHLKFGLIELETETAKREIGNAKSSALAEIEREVTSQKESIRLLISNANKTSDKLEDQRETLSALIDKATALQNKIEKQKEEILKLNQQSQAAKEEIKKLNAASSQIALTLVKATYLTLVTKSEFGSSPRLQKATAEIEKDINRILPMVIPDPQERAYWIQQLQNTLPERQ